MNPSGAIGPHAWCVSLIDERMGMVIVDMVLDLLNYSCISVYIYIYFFWNKKKVLLRG